MADNAGFFASRSWRRLLVIALVVPLIVLESILEPLSRLIHQFIVFVGLSRLEDWLRRQPLWFAVVPLAFAVGVFMFFEVYQYVVLAQGHYLLFLLFHGLKWTAVPILNYVLGLYREQLLTVRWIRRLYLSYRWNYRWLHRRPWYKQVLLLKEEAKEFVKEQWKLARETLARWTEALRRRRSAWATARRLRQRRMNKH